MITGSRRNFDHLEAQLALGYFLQRDVHKGQLRVERNEGTKSLAKLADALGNDIHENLGAVDDFKSVLDEGLFHKVRERS